jgi:hypothetical protein
VLEYRVGDKDMPTLIFDRKRSLGLTSPRERLCEPPAEVIELLKAPKTDADFATVSQVAYCYFGAECKTEIIFDRASIWICDRRSQAASRFARICSKPFDITDGQSLSDNSIHKQIRIRHR